MVAKDSHLVRVRGVQENLISMYQYVCMGFEITMVLIFAVKSTCLDCMTHAAGQVHGGNQDQPSTVRT